MSVLVTLWAKGDPRKLEEFASSHEEEMQSIVRSAKENGLIAHRFYGTDDGQVMVIDEWPDQQSFETFFESTREEIGPLMEAMEAQGEPGINFWRQLETGDEVGWGG